MPNQPRTADRNDAAGELASASERENTDESLRVERERADQALAEALADLDETADAVIVRARIRAREVLATARAKADEERASAAEGRRTEERIRQERAGEDRVLGAEHAAADDTLQDEREEQSMLLSSGRSETDEHLFDERARSDENVASRDEFLGLVGHDLRNILHSMVSYASLIAASVTRENHVEQVLAHAHRIQKSASHMDRLIGDLLDVARIQADMFPLTREVGDPHDVVNEAVESMQARAAAREVSLRAEIVPPVPTLAFDPARILQVLVNLISNAIKFTPIESEVVVRLESVEDALRFSVRDRGHGIPEHMLESVFERFLQVIANDRRGVGLGLYIAKGIVHAHGGRIWAQSREGGGSTFAFTLPLSQTG